MVIVEIEDDEHVYQEVIYEQELSFCQECMCWCMTLSLSVDSGGVQRPVTSKMKQNDK